MMWFKNLRRRYQHVDETIHVDAGEKACQILVEDERCWCGVEVCGLEKFDEVKNVPFGQVARASLRQELVNELGDAVQHRSERCMHTADDRAPGAISLSLFGQHIGVW